MTRITFSIGLILLTVSLQVLILSGTKAYVTPQAVASIRDSYDEYETAMYNGHTVLNANGKNRGIPEFFNASAFDELSGDLQSDVCNIPMSQMGFLWLILVVWSITCMAQLKKCMENFMALIFFAKNKDSMAEALEEDEDGDDDDDEDADECNDGVPTMVITGLTVQVKAMLVLFVFLPDFLCTSYMLWLGSRWLVATNDFGNLISNAVALEFLLMLKCLLFVALVSDRNKRDLSHTALAPSWDKEPAGYGIYFSALGWGVLSVLWVWVYVNNQGVLLDYRYDVHEVCTVWLNNQLNPDYSSGTDD